MLTSAVKEGVVIMKKRVKTLSLFCAVAFLVFMYPTYGYSMHIMEGFLSAKWCLLWYAVSAPFFIYGIVQLNKLFKEKPEQKLLVALSGAFVFLLSALKIPSVTGSCSHPTGVGLGAILFGPTIMTVCGVIVLLFQAVLLAHGGITTLGANTFSMAIVGPFVAYFIYKACRKANVNTFVAVFLAAALADLTTYVVTAFQLAIAYPDPASGLMGSLVKFLTVFAVTQVPIAIAEGIITALIFDKIVEYEGRGVLLEKIN